MTQHFKLYNQLFLLTGFLLLTNGTVMKAMMDEFTDAEEIEAVSSLAGAVVESKSRGSESHENRLALLRDPEAAMRFGTALGTAISASRFAAIPDPDTAKRMGQAEAEQVKAAVLGSSSFSDAEIAQMADNRRKIADAHELPLKTLVKKAKKQGKIDKARRLESCYTIAEARKIGKQTRILQEFSEPTENNLRLREVYKARARKAGMLEGQFSAEEAIQMGNSARALEDAMRPSFGRRLGDLGWNAANSAISTSMYVGAQIFLPEIAAGAKYYLAEIKNYLRKRKMTPEELEKELKMQEQMAMAVMQKKMFVEQMALEKMKNDNTESKKRILNGDKELVSGAIDLLQKYKSTVGVNNAQREAVVGVVEQHITDAMMGYVIKTNREINPQLFQQQARPMPGIKDQKQEQKQTAESE